MVLVLLKGVYSIVLVSAGRLGAAERTENS